MKMSTKGRYAVMAMIDIAQHSGGGPVSLAEIAERQDISQEYLEQLFGKLRRGRSCRKRAGAGRRLSLGPRCRPKFPWPKSSLPSTSPCGLPVAKATPSKAVSRVERCCAHDLWSSLGRQMMYFLASDHPR